MGFYVTEDLNIIERYAIPDDQLFVSNQEENINLVDIQLENRAVKGFLTVKNYGTVIAEED